MRRSGASRKPRSRLLRAVAGRQSNIGQGRADHILPLSGFQFETAADPEFQAAWALANLRPLWSGDNIRKNAKRLYLL